MSILKYIQRLVPTFSRNKIVEGCEVAARSIKEHTLPAYVSADELFKGKKFSSDAAKDFAQQFDRIVGKTSGGTMVTTIKDGLQNALTLLQDIAVDSKDIYSDTEASISLTYVKATYLRIVEASSFANEYARKFLNYIFILETAEASEEFSVADSLSPAEIAWLNSGFLDFCLAIEILSRDVKETQKLIKTIPDALITSLTEKTFPSTIGQSKIDPFKMNQFSAAVNPFYFFGMFIAERQAEQYKTAQAELDLLQLRLLNLQKIQAKTADASLQKEIDVMEGRVKILAYKQREAEKEWLHG